MAARDVHDAAADALGEGEADRAELLPSGVQLVYKNRAGWAHDRLKRAGLSASRRRGYWQLTEAGARFAQEQPSPLPVPVLEAFLTEYNGVRLRPAAAAPDIEGTANRVAVPERATISPDDRLEHALAELRAGVTGELLELLSQVSPAYFETVVLDLLHKLGYGTGRADLLRVGRSGDGGIDGVISLDRLGLEKVYVQAKRWQSSVGRPDVQGFYGALAARHDRGASTSPSGVPVSGCGGDLPARATPSHMTFIHGCNYPWSTDGTTVFYGLDFGANVWGSHLGVSTRRPAIERDFAGMAALGFTAARWFLFCDGRAGIVYDDRGFPSGPDAHLFADVDAALEIARDTGIGIAFALLDHRWMFKGVRDTFADPVTGDLLEGRLPDGRARVLLTAAGRDALFERVIEPVVRRYCPTGDRADLAAQVLAYEFMNEPDFVIEEWEQDLSAHVARPLPFATIEELVARLSACVHRHSQALTTLGGARLRNLWAWDDNALGLDLLQVHSYPDQKHPQRDSDPFGTAARDLGFARPLLLGEFPGNPREQRPAHASPPERDLDDYLEFALAGGYAGAWPWSFSGTDAYGTLPAEPLRRFASRYPELANPRARR